MPTRLLSVEIEEDVYNFVPPENGAGPMWCFGSTCMVRSGKKLFASGIETIENIESVNRCRWMLFQRGNNGWNLIKKDFKHKTREPCPIGLFNDGRLFLTVNNAIASEEKLTTPGILQFNTEKPSSEIKVINPQWTDSPRFTHHSYRSFATDAKSHEMIFFQNIDYKHAEWAFCNRKGEWKNGQLIWPQEKQNGNVFPLRICYPNVALNNRTVHFFGVCDIREPVKEWEAYKYDLTKREWDYVFRRLFYTYSTDITSGKFSKWIEINNVEATAGETWNGDLWIAPDGTAHLLWNSREIDERLRSEFFPATKQKYSLNYTVIKNGRIIEQRPLIVNEESESTEIISRPRFYITPDHRLFAIYYLTTADKTISENQLIEIRPENDQSLQEIIPVQEPLPLFFTATSRAGSPLSEYLEMYGVPVGKNKIRYIKIKIT